MPPRLFTPEEETCIVQIYEARHSKRAIARAYNLKWKMAVDSAIKRAGVHVRPNTEANRLYTINHESFDVITPESAYWWGFIYADGSINRHKSLTVGLRHTDVDHVIALNEFLQSNAPVKIKDRWLKPHKGAYLHVTSQHMGARLEELGVLAHRPSFNLVLKNLPDEFTSHWLRGLFDGDGSVRSKVSQKTPPGLGFCGAKEMMVFTRAYIAKNASTNPNLKIYQHPTGLCYLRYTGRKQCIRIAGVLYKDASIWLKRKRDVIESWPAPQIRVRDALGRYT